MNTYSIKIKKLDDVKWTVIGAAMSDNAKNALAQFVSFECGQWFYDSNTDDIYIGYTENGDFCAVPA